MIKLTIYMELIETPNPNAKKIIIKNKYNKIKFSRSKIFCDIDTLDDIKNFN